MSHLVLNELLEQLISWIHKISSFNTVTEILSSYGKVEFVCVDHFPFQVQLTFEKNISYN